MRKEFSSIFEKGNNLENICGTSQVMELHSLERSGSCNRAQEMYNEIIHAQYSGPNKPSLFCRYSVKEDIQSKLQWVYERGKAMKEKVKGILYRIKSIGSIELPTGEEFEKARNSAMKLRAKFPNEFTVKGKECPDLHFVADPDVAGRFTAEIDRNDLLGRKHKK